jgi:hypothetical protein
MSTAVEMIQAHWPEHVGHTVKYGPATMDQGAGVLCGCGEVLWWPVEEPPEEDEPEPTPLELQRPKSARGREAFDKAAAAVAAARAKATPRTDDYAAEGPKTGAYGTYERKEEPVTESEIVDAEVIEEPREVAVTMVADLPKTPQDVGPWLDTSTEPPTVRNGPALEVLADLGVADEAQAVTMGDPEYQVGDTVTVGGTTFVKQAEHPSVYTPPEPSTITEEEAAQIMNDYQGRLTEEELAVNLGTAPDGEARLEEVYENGEVDSPNEGNELTVTGPEPGSGTPILPTDPDSLDPVMGLLPPLDPTQVYTPKDVEIGILEILRKLQNGELFLREQLARLHVAEHAHIMRYNLKIKTSNARAADQRKADAILACERERYEQAEAEMLVLAIRATLHSLRSQLMGLQTVARSLGVSIGGPSYGP